MTDFNKIKQYKQECVLKFSSLTNDELIDSFNGMVRISAWGFYRAALVDSIREEILKRDFDSSILFDNDSNGTAISFKLANKVIIKNRKLVLL